MMILKKYAVFKSIRKSIKPDDDNLYISSVSIDIEFGPIARMRPKKEQANNATKPAKERVYAVEVKFRARHQSDNAIHNGSVYYEPIDELFANNDHLLPVHDFLLANMDRPKWRGFREWAATTFPTFGASEVPFATDSIVIFKRGFYVVSRIFAPMVIFAPPYRSQIDIYDARKLNVADTLAKADFVYDDEDDKKRLYVTDGDCDDVHLFREPTNRAFRMAQRGSSLTPLPIALLLLLSDADKAFDVFKVHFGSAAQLFTSKRSNGWRYESPKYKLPKFAVDFMRKEISNRGREVGELVKQEMRTKEVPFDYVWQVAGNDDVKEFRNIELILGSPYWSRWDKQEEELWWLHSMIVMFSVSNGTVQVTGTIVKEKDGFIYYELE